MNSYLTVLRNIPAAGRGSDVVLATVLKVGAPVEWAKKNANKIAARITKSNDQLPPIVAMWASEQPPDGMESAA